MFIFISAHLGRGPWVPLILENYIYDSYMILCPGVKICDSPFPHSSCLTFSSGNFHFQFQFLSSEKVDLRTGSK